AIVHTLAYANFQDRILLALGTQVEAGGPLPPLDVRLDRATKPAAAARWPWAELRSARPAVSEFRPDWAGRNFDVQKALEQQKARKGRILPPDEARLAKLPAEARKRMGRIVWTQVSMGYQPRLTQAWFDCMTAFQEE